MRLKGKIIVVTGASGGMGNVAVDLFIQQGATVVALDLDKERLPEQCDKLLPLSCDLTNEEEVESVFREIFEHFDKIDVLINFAGIAQKATSIENVTLSMWHKLMEINATAVFLTCREAVKYMKPKKTGSIINVASISAVRPRPGLQSYIASKGATVSLSQALAIELASDNIRVNVIHPGPCDTNMLGQFSSDDKNVEKEKEEVFIKSIPMGRLIEPKDIANTAIFLASDESKMMTGTILHVDGGRGI